MGSPAHAGIDRIPTGDGVDARRFPRTRGDRPLAGTDWEREENKYLPADQIAEMRLYYKAGHRIVDLAEHFGVHPVSAWRIVHYKTHKNVPDDAPPLGFDVDVDSAPVERSKKSSVQDLEAIFSQEEPVLLDKIRYSGAWKATRYCLEFLKLIASKGGMRDRKEEATD